MWWRRRRRATTTAAHWTSVAQVSSSRIHPARRVQAVLVPWHVRVTSGAVTALALPAIASSQRGICTMSACAWRAWYACQHV